MTVDSNSCFGGFDMADDKAWPPGFRFHPTDEELILYYLKKKICKRRLILDIIRELDVYKWDPEDLPGQSLLKTGDRQWFFFSPRDRKYPSGGRSNRATRQGYWKATGKDRNITCNSRAVGVKKTLVFYRGRAPNGERTDWVMHEYTMDEKELNRCPNVKDYYALYKVYKKSGPGPKNGEQYGAPFKEEEWADDVCGNPNNLDAPVKQPVISPPPVINNESAAQMELPLTNLENLMNHIGDEDRLDFVLSQMAYEDQLDFPPIADFTSTFSQVTGDEETQSTLVDPSNKEVSLGGPNPVPDTSCEQYDLLGNLDFNQSATSMLHPLEAPKFTCFPEQASELCEGEFLEMDDFMGPEMSLNKTEKHTENLNFDDCNGPEPTFSKTEKHTENLIFEGFDGPECAINKFEKSTENLNFGDFNGPDDLDLYHEAAMFFREMGPVGQETLSHENEEFQLQQHSMANQVDYLLPPHSSGNNMDYLQAQVFGADELWVDDAINNVFTASEPNGTLSESSPGAKSATVMNPSETNQKQSSEDESTRGGWIASALWGFVESIPTTPASASERPLVNKAFERMSSFSRMKMSMKNSNIISGNLSNSNANANVNVNTWRAGGRGNRGFIWLSILGAVCAILWVLVGSVRVMGRAIFS